jgi:hypothetical protein
LSFNAPKLADIRNFSKFYSTTVTRAILSYQYQPRQLRDSCAKVPSVSLILLHKSTISPFLDSQGQRAQLLFLPYSSNLPRLRVYDPTSFNHIAASFKKLFSCCVPEEQVVLQALNLIRLDRRLSSSMLPASQQLCLVHPV